MIYSLGEIEDIVRMDVLKREIVDGEQTEAAQARINKFYRKISTPRRRKRDGAEGSIITASPVESATERLLRETEEEASGGDPEAQDSGRR